MTTPRITIDSLHIVGITPESFSDGGRYTRPDVALKQALNLHRDSADIIDAGGESTCPGAVPVYPDVEQSRILPIIEALVTRGITVSVDTMHAETAFAALCAGASIINDISGGLADPTMLCALAREQCQVVLGHMRGTPARGNRVRTTPTSSARLLASSRNASGPPATPESRPTELS